MYIQLAWFWKQCLAWFTFLKKHPYRGVSRFSTELIVLPTHTCYSTKFETGNTPQDTSPHHRRNPTQPQYTILSTALYPDCNDDSWVNGHQNGKGPSFIFYNYCESQMNWESQVSTENSTGFHTANNSKNPQTKDLNQIFTKPIESKTETKDSQTKSSQS